MALPKEPNAEPIPGYRLIEMLGKGGCGEVWKCEAPGGLFKAIKFVYGNLNSLDDDRAAAEEELRAIEYVKTIRHPFLLSMDRVEAVQGELIIVSELADQSLHQVLEEHRQQGQQGMPRELLLNLLREAAEVLDLFNFQYGLQHLDIKPHNLFLVSNHVKVADFGLVNRLSTTGPALAAQLQVGATTPLYAAPEIFQGRISSHADQYSLAVTYQELLTGSLPFEGDNSRQLLMLHTNAEPNLSQLPVDDRPLVARALAKKPGQRFPSCTAFVQALAAGHQSGQPSFPGVWSGGKAEGFTFSPLLPKRGKGVGSEGVTDALPQAASRRNPLPRREGDTDPNLHGLTERPRPQPRQPGQDSLPKGYKFIKCLENSPLAERWQVESPDARKRAVKILYGSHALSEEQLQEALLQLRSLEHPALTHLDVLQSKPGRIVVATDLIEQSLRDYMHRCQSRKLPGIPRSDLLSFLLTAAEALDYLYRQHSIQHLSLGPRNLLLDHGQLLIDEFGLGQLIWLPAGQLLSQPGKRYAAPELSRGQVSTSCDQFSLALIYVELLTGNLPRGSQAGQEPAPIRLDQLPSEDVEIIARALSPDPARRWPSCVDFIRALEGGQFTPSMREQADFDEFTTLVESGAVAQALPSTQASATSAVALQQMITDLIHSASGDVNLSLPERAPELSADGLMVQHQFSAGIPLGEARLKLDQVREQLNGKLIHDDGKNYCFQLSMPSGFWARWTGRQPALEMLVTLARQHALAPTPIDIGVQIKPLRCSRKRGKELLSEMSLPLLEQLRAALLVNSEKRIKDRLLWPYLVEVCPILPDGTRGQTVLCRGKDISLTGIGFYLPHPLETSNVVINLPAIGSTEAISIPATLVRARLSADGWYEVGALFRLTTLRGAQADLHVKI
jgi:serine/threonine protein kinase